MSGEHGGPMHRFIDRAVRSHEQREEITRRQAERDADDEPRWNMLVGEHPDHPGFCQALLVDGRCGRPTCTDQADQFPATAASEWTPEERMDYGGAPSGVTG